MTEDVKVKKAYQELVDFLRANEDKKVKSVLAQVIEMCTAKTAGGVATASHRDENGNVVAIRCNFFDKWFPISHVEFGKKEGSATGFNSMCKEGANAFSKQQRDFRAAKEKLLERVAAGEVEPADIQKHLEDLETARKTIPAFSIPGMGWDTLEECLAQTTEDLDALVAAAEAAQAEADAAAAEEAGEVAGVE